MTLLSEAEALPRDGQAPGVLGAQLGKGVGGGMD